MSKKLAESLNALVLDVKTGSGAFMHRIEDARLLARLMVETGQTAGTRTVALITNHSQPIGRYAGNWLEVKECIDIMKQDRHPMSADLIDLTNILAGWMLHLAHRAETPEAGALLSDELLRNGAAYAAWLKIVAAQGGDTRIFDHPEAFHQIRATHILQAETSGFLSAIDTTATGWAVQRLGTGRAKPSDPVAPHAGIEVRAKLGDPIIAGQPLVTLHAAHESLLSGPFKLLRTAYRITPEPPLLHPQGHEIIAR